MTFDEQFRDLVREAVQQSAREHLSVQYIELSRQIRARVDEALAPIVARREYDANHPFKALVGVAREVERYLEPINLKVKTANDGEVNVPVPSISNPKLDRSIRALVTLILMGEDE